MRCSEIITQIEQMAPLRYACDWDNPGLLAGRMDKEVKTVMMALDLSDVVLTAAIEKKVDLIITHHPLIFKPLKKINDQHFISRRILQLIQHDIAYYAAHTNFDITPGGMADLAADRLGLTECHVLEPLFFDQEQPLGIGRIGALVKALSLADLGSLTKTRFDLPYVAVYGIEQLRQQLINRVAICPGAGSSVVDQALLKGAQVLITGDISHHVGIDAAAQGMAVIDAGHYGLEHIFSDFMEQYFKRHISTDLLVYKEQIVFPTAIIT